MAKKKDADVETEEVIEEARAEVTEDGDANEDPVVVALRAMLHEKNEAYTDARNARTQAFALGEIAALQMALKTLGAKDRLPRFHKGESEKLGLR